MPITKSAKKALRQSKTRRVFNLRRIAAMKSAIKQAQKTKNISLAYKAIDKAAKRGVIKKNTAARKKSRLAKFLSKK